MIFAALLLAAAHTMTFTADRVAADNVTKAVVATGHVHAAYGPITLRSTALERGADGVVHFRDPTSVTTCTNELGHTHWGVSGEVEYEADDHVLVKNAWLEFCEIPVFYLPYLWYPLDTSCGFSWMPGYTSRWGGYLLTRYRYQIAGDPERKSDTWWLKGATRLDLRSRKGVGIGEDLGWNLGDFGRGSMNLYYAWDEDHTRGRSTNGGWNSEHWGSWVDRDRYLVSLEHRWEATERDTVRVQGSYLSDSYFLSDFERNGFFGNRARWLNYRNNGVFWEHAENDFAFGVEASGRLNDFYSMVDRLPELYFNVNPLPVFDTRVNYESTTKIGYLRRNYAKYGRGDIDDPFAYNPGLWADYETMRIHTYHRFTLPMRTFGDVLAVVPRIAYQGSYWAKSSGQGHDMHRSILEGGVTFSSRGKAWIDERWQHMIEPYLDVLAQDAWYTGDKHGSRPYLFDNLDGSRIWEDQFAGRSRNLPYAYYGITPGLRNSWSKLEENGRLRTVFDLDVYGAMQFNEARWTSGNARHRLAELGKPNYGRRRLTVIPGVRARWAVSDDLALAVRGEYDEEHNTLALGSATLSHRIDDDFSWYGGYEKRDYRYWDFSDAPYDPEYMTKDELNNVKFEMATIGFKYQPVEFLCLSPYIRWDVREGELDVVGGWLDLLTDCLGFRFIFEYENDYRTIDGWERDEDFRVGFYIYLRALGADNGGLFSGE